MHPPAGARLLHGGSRGAGTTLPERHTGCRGSPRHSLTEPCSAPGEVAEGRLREAWEETAGRLGLVRLGWIPTGTPGHGDDEALVHPTLRAIARWRHAAAPGGAAASGSAAEDLVVIQGTGGRLIAGARRGGLPNRRSLEEVAALAAALPRAEARPRRPRACPGRPRGPASARSGPDLRNKLTRALLFEARSRHPESMGDRPATEARDELERALHAARELAQEALRGDHGAVFSRPLEPVPLKAILEQERAAAEAARTEPGASPRLRLAGARSPECSRVQELRAGCQEPGHERPRGRRAKTGRRRDR